MSKKTVAFRKAKNRGRFGIIALVLLIVTFFTAMFAYNGNSLWQQKKELAAQTEQLNARLEAERQRSEELAAFETYTHTKKYAEEVAKEKLGYVYEGEIIFQKDR